MVESGNFIVEQAAFTELGRSLFRLLSEGDDRIEYLATVLSAVTYERVRAFNSEGRLESAAGNFNSARIPDDVSEQLRTLREANYREGAGTWFSIKVTVTAAGAGTAEYNYDREPEWDAPVDSIAYVTDLEKFPRDEANQPEWLRQKLAEGRERLATRGKQR